MATGKVISGTLKTFAGIIPDSSDMKSFDKDKKVAQVIDTNVLPSDKQEFFELLRLAKPYMPKKRFGLF